MLIWEQNRQTKDQPVELRQMQYFLCLAEEKNVTRLRASSTSCSRR